VGVCAASLLGAASGGAVWAGVAGSPGTPQRLRTRCAVRGRTAGCGTSARPSRPMSAMSGDWRAGPFGNRDSD